MQAVVGLVLLWAALALAGKKNTIHEILHKVDMVGEAAEKLTDAEMRRDVLLIREKIKMKIEGSQLDHDQLAAANQLLAFILQKMRDGKITLFQVKHFIKFAQSNRLDRLLATWDKNLLKIKPNV